MSQILRVETQTVEQRDGRAVFFLELERESGSLLAFGVR